MSPQIVSTHHTDKEMTEVHEEIKRLYKQYIYLYTRYITRGKGEVGTIIQIHNHTYIHTPLSLFPSLTLSLSISSPLSLSLSLSLPLPLVPLSLSFSISLPLSLSLSFPLSLALSFSPSPVPL